MCGAGVDVSATVTCPVCGRTVPRKMPHQRRCGSRQCKRKDQYRTAHQREDYRERNKARCRAWYEAHKAEHVRNVEVRRVLKSGVKGPWFMTPHAVERFRNRAGWQRASDYESALAALIDESRGAHFVKTLNTGAELWRGPKPRRLRFIVGAGDGALPALVTVLGSYDRC